MPRENKPFRVLIVRLGAMGDVLHALPAATALRAQHPEWFLGWTIEPRWAPLLRAGEDAEPRSAAMPLVDRVHIAHARGWARAPLSRGTWRAIQELRSELREAEYDLCIDLQGAVRSALIGRMASAQLAGEAKPREAPAKWLFAQKIETHGVHVIEQAVEVVAAAVREPLQPASASLLPRDAAADRWVCNLLGSDQQLALVNPGAGWGAKRWPAVRYGAVCRSLGTQGFRVLVNAGPGEEEIAREVAAASGSAEALPMSLNQLIAVTRRASLVIAGDTGPLHLACALGRPVVGIFGPTDPARNGPYGVPFRVLRHPESKRDHSRRREPEAGLLTITADEVLAAAEAVLAEAAPA